jgi:hypothetical protein
MQPPAPPSLPVASDESKEDLAEQQPQVEDAETQS